MMELMTDTRRHKVYFVIFSYVVIERTMDASSIKKVKYKVLGIYGEIITLSFEASITTVKDLERAWYDQAVKPGYAGSGPCVVAVGKKYMSFRDLTSDMLESLKEIDVVVISHHLDVNHHKFDHCAFY